MRYTGQLDFTTKPNPGYARPSGAATFETAAGRVGWAHPNRSDPSTGAISGTAQTTVTPPSSVKRNFWFVVGLTFVTMWLESGKRGGLL